MERVLKKCIIVGAGEFSGFHPEFTADYVIAADAGYEQVIINSEQLIMSKQPTVDLVVGDFDSFLGEVPEGVEVLRFSAEKCESDLELAVLEAVRRGFDCLYIYGALGKRLDHTLGGIAVLAGVSRLGVTAWLIGENEIVTAVTDGKITLTARESGVVSLFPAGGDAAGVTLRGLKYTLNDAVLNYDKTVGLSNEFVGKEAVIEVADGTLVIIIPKNT
ncbi:MAG: thiamine diphosphokinase [Oscillospiraceae bacterium]|nr:thiamine diphosphokinase [Oscillospiraceae bacterium]